jgi:hypothetical protein
MHTPCTGTPSARRAHTCWVGGQHHQADGQDEGVQLQRHPGPCALQQPREAAHQRRQQHEAQQHRLGSVGEEQRARLLVEPVPLLDDDCMAFGGRSAGVSAQARARRGLLVSQGQRARR